MPRVLLLALLIGALVPVPAAAQEGSGLYGPSPRMAPAARAERFVSELLSAAAGRRVDGPSRAELRQGVFTGSFAGAQARRGAATDRAVDAGGWLPSPAWPLLLALLLGAVGLAARGRSLGPAARAAPR